MKKEVKKLLANANKETKTLSGSAKIIRTFWAAGYKEVAKDFNLTFADFADIPALINRMQKDAERNIFITVNKAVKDENGNFMLDKNGKRVYKAVNKVVNVWTPNTFFKVLEQSSK